MVVTMGHTFDDVLAAAKLGADWAWAVLYAEVSGPVMGFFRCRGVSDPEEAAGEVFFELARVVDDFDGDEEEFRTTVFRLAYRRLMAEKHYSQSGTRSALADQVLDRLQRNVAVMDTVGQEEIPNDLRTVFATLTPDQRDVLTMRVVSHLSLEQTAAVIDRPLDDVSSIQRRALGRVRRTLGAGVVLS
jgi:RNA polymerase sigma factor (sigma-70 family)